MNELTKQEERILGLIAKGKSNGEIAEALFISVTTVKTHCNTLYQKLHLSRPGKTGEYVHLRVKAAIWYWRRKVKKNAI